ncbi:MAG: iron-containing alcohol dehydrogenase [Lachnospiraceae bacterium]|nr:iron-containing alcohol dehydrogenase [Lachnospiraceae bacterium]
MNIFKKIYCRIFQKCFHIALPFLPYQDPRIERHVVAIPGILKAEGVKKPLIITDSNISGLGLPDSLKAALDKNGMDYAYFDRAFPNPTIALCEEAHDFYAAKGCDSIIAFGGGSPMDLAKACGIIEARPDKPLSKMGGILKVRKKLPLLIAIPTTAGTGSETTLAAVVVDGRTRHKFAINDFPLIPKYAVLDQAMVHSSPSFVAATTGLDALTHAVEAYIGKSTTRKTRAAAEKAVFLIFRNLDQAVKHQSASSEGAMLAAAHYAGRAFTRSYVGYVHALSHALSGAYDLPHGWTNAVILPIVLRRYGRCIDKKLAKLALCAGLGEPDENAGVLAERFISAIEAMNIKYGIPERIEAIKEEDIKTLAKYADKEANPLYPVPVLWDRKELANIYRLLKG